MHTSTSGTYVSNIENQKVGSFQNLVKKLVFIYYIMKTCIYVHTIHTD